MGELMIDLYNYKGITRFVVVLALNEDERQLSLGIKNESNLFVLVLNLLKCMEERLMYLPEGHHKLMDTND